MTGETISPRALKATTTINLLAGLWLFISPWVYGGWWAERAWNSWIAGAIVAILAMIRLSNLGGLTTLSRLNMMMGVWIFVSPWVFGYTVNEPRFVNSLLVGLLVFLLGAFNSGLSGEPVRHG